MASIRKQGKNWQAIIRHKGQKTLSKTFPKKVLATTWARKTEENLYAKQVNGLASYTSTQEILDRYREEIMPRKRGSREEGYRLDSLIRYLGSYTLAELTPERVVSYIDTRLDTITSCSIRKEISLLSAAITAAQNLWGIELLENPVKRARQALKTTKTLKPDVKRDRRPTPEELDCLYAVLPWEMASLVAFAAETAMRRGEICNMKPTDRKGNLLHIPKTKIDIARTIPLTPNAQAILDMVGGQFKYAESSISHMFKRACKKCKIDDLRFHDMRHEGASRFFEVFGLDIAEVALITGQTFVTLQRYTNLKPEMIAEKLK